MVSQIIIEGLSVVGQPWMSNFNQLGFAPRVDLIVLMMGASREAEMDAVFLAIREL